MIDIIRKTEIFLDKIIIDELTKLYPHAHINDGSSGDVNEFYLGYSNWNYHIDPEKVELKYDPQIVNLTNFNNIINDIMNEIEKKINSIYQLSKGMTIIFYNGVNIELENYCTTIEVTIGVAGVIEMKEINQIIY